jgi:hypothetical protein
MELVSRSALPLRTIIYPSVVNWTTKKVLGVYSKPNAVFVLGAIDMTKHTRIVLPRR